MFVCVVANHDADKKIGGTLIDDGGGKSFGKEIMLTVQEFGERLAHMPTLDFGELNG